MDLDEGEQYFCSMPTYSDAWAPVSCVNGFASRRPTFYDDTNRYNWERIKNLWNEAWSKNDSDNLRPVRIEKSPPNIFRFSLLNQNFDNAYFIGMLRNPYCQIEAWRRHFGGNCRGNQLHDFYVDWVYHAEYMIKAMNELPKSRFLFIAYEDVIHNTKMVEEKIRSFLPDNLLADFSFQNIINNNKISLSRFMYDDVSMITDAMTDNTAFTIERITKDRTFKVLDKFDYGVFSRIKMLSSVEYSFFTEKYTPNWKNDRFVEYYTIGKDGLIHESVPSWITYFGAASPKYNSMYYSKWRKI